ncbi:hypothetical protein M0802_004294 [Mischocyttarus mexicanus]|nr:hypothetical protein M0802_004294 [Mischocyttarus mexicanus]
MRLNSVIPNFKAETTQGPIDFYEWQGKSWVVLFSHPADFTPVCTTELGRIAVHQPHFERRNAKLLAHSVDKLKDHVDWVNDIKSYCRDIPGAFPYPIIADADRSLAVKLDMIDEDSKDDQETAQTVRALYVISPDHRLRLSMHYPASTGRNPGEKVMILPTVKDEDLPKLFPKGVDKVSMPSGKVYVRTTTDY